MANKQYLIDIAIRDDKIKSSLIKAFQDPEIKRTLGASGETLIDSLREGGEKAKSQLTSIFGGLDWAKLLGKDDLLHLQQLVSNVVSANKDMIKALSKEGDISGIQKVIDTIVALGNELKEIGVSFDSKGLARSMGAFMKVLVPLSAKIEALAEEPERIGAAFDRMFGDANGISNFSTNIDTAIELTKELDNVIINLSGDAKKVENTTKSIETYQKVLEELSKKKYEIKVEGLSIGELEDQYDTMVDAGKSAKEEIDKIDKSLEQSNIQEKEKNKLLGQRKAHEFNLARTMLARLAIDKRYKFLTKKSLIEIDKNERDSRLDQWKSEQKAAGNTVTDNAIKQERGKINRQLREEQRVDWRAYVDSMIKTFEDALKQAKEKFESILGKDIGRIISEKLSTLNIKLDLSEQSKEAFVGKVNEYINSLQGKIIPVRVKLEREDDPTNVNPPEKKDKRGRPRKDKSDEVKSIKNDIEQKLKEAENEYNKLKSQIEEQEKQLKDNKHDKALGSKVEEDKKRLGELNKSLTTYNYLLAHIDDTKEGAALATDWENFDRKSKVITAGQEKLLDDTRKWREKMNGALTLRYTWNSDNATSEIGELLKKVQSYFALPEHYIPIFPDTDAFIETIEAALEDKKFKIQIESGNGIIVNGIIGSNGGGSTISDIEKSDSKNPKNKKPKKTEERFEAEEPEGKDVEKSELLTSSINERYKNAIEFAQKYIDDSKKLDEDIADEAKKLGVTEKGFPWRVKEINKNTEVWEKLSNHGTSISEIEEKLKNREVGSENDEDFLRKALEKYNGKKIDEEALRDLIKDRYNKKKDYSTRVSDLLKKKREENKYLLDASKEILGINKEISRNPKNEEIISEEAENIHRALLDAFINSVNNFVKDNNNTQNKASSDLKKAEEDIAKAEEAYNNAKKEEGRKAAKEKLSAAAKARKRAEETLERAQARRQKFEQIVQLDNIEYKDGFIKEGFIELSKKEDKEALYEFAEKKINRYDFVRSMNKSRISTSGAQNIKLVVDQIQKIYGIKQATRTSEEDSVYADAKSVLEGINKQARGAVALKKVIDSSKVGLPGSDEFDELQGFFESIGENKDGGIYASHLVALKEYKSASDYFLKNLNQETKESFNNALNKTTWFVDSIVEEFNKLDDNSDVKKNIIEKLNIKKDTDLSEVFARRENVGKMLEITSKQESGAPLKSVLETFNAYFPVIDKQAAFMESVAGFSPAEKIEREFKAIPKNKLEEIFGVEVDKTMDFKDKFSDPEILSGMLAKIDKYEEEHEGDNIASGLRNAIESFEKTGERYVKSTIKNILGTFENTIFKVKWVDSSGEQHEASYGATGTTVEAKTNVDKGRYGTLIYKILDEVYKEGSEIISLDFYAKNSREKYRKSYEGDLPPAYNPVIDYRESKRKAEEDYKLRIANATSVNYKEKADKDLEALGTKADSLEAEVKTLKGELAKIEDSLKAFDSFDSPEVVGKYDEAMKKAKEVMGEYDEAMEKAKSKGQGMIEIVDAIRDNPAILPEKAKEAKSIKDLENLSDELEDSSSKTGLKNFINLVKEKVEKFDIEDDIFAKLSKDLIPFAEKLNNKNKIGPDDPHFAGEELNKNEEVRKIKEKLTSGYIVDTAKNFYQSKDLDTSLRDSMESLAQEAIKIKNELSAVELSADDKDKKKEVENKINRLTIKLGNTLEALKLLKDKYDDAYEKGNIADKKESPYDNYDKITELSSEYEKKYGKNYKGYKELVAQKGWLSEQIEKKKTEAEEARSEHNKQSVVKLSKEQKDLANKRLEIKEEIKKISDDDSRKEMLQAELDTIEREIEKLETLAQKIKRLEAEGNRSDSTDDAAALAAKNKKIKDAAERNLPVIKQQISALTILNTEARYRMGILSSKKKNKAQREGMENEIFNSYVKDMVERTKQQSGFSHAEGKDKNKLSTREKYNNELFESIKNDFDKRFLEESVRISEIEGMSEEDKSAELENVRKKIVEDLLNKEEIVKREIKIRNEVISARTEEIKELEALDKEIKEDLAKIEKQEKQKVDSSSETKKERARNTSNKKGSKKESLEPEVDPKAMGEHIEGAAKEEEPVVETGIKVDPKAMGEHIEGAAEEEEPVVETGIKVDPKAMGEHIEGAAEEEEPVVETGIKVDPKAMGEHIEGAAEKEKPVVKPTIEVDPEDVTKLIKYVAETSFNTTPIKAPAPKVPWEIKNADKAISSYSSVRASAEMATESGEINENARIWKEYVDTRKELQDKLTEINNLTKDKDKSIFEDDDIKERLSEISILTAKVNSLGKSIQRTSDYLAQVRQANPGSMENLGIDQTGDRAARDSQIEKAMSEFAQTRAMSKGLRYDKVSFDSNKLIYNLTDVAGNVTKVTAAWDELHNVIYVDSSKSVAAIDPLIKKVQTFKDLIENATKPEVGYLSADDSIVTNFDEKYKKLEEIQEKIKSNAYETVKEFNDAWSELGSIAKDLEKFGRIAEKEIKNVEKLYGGRKEYLAAKEQNYRIGEKIDKNASPMAKQYADAYEKLVKHHDDYVEKRKMYDHKIRASLKQEALDVQKMGKSLEASIAEAERLEGLINNSGTFTDKFGKEHVLGKKKENVQFKNFKEMEAAMRAFAKETLGVELASTKFNDKTQTLTGTLRQNNKVVSDMAVKYNAATSSFYLFEEKERESLAGLPGMINGLKQKTKAILQYVASMTSIYRITSILRKGVQYVREIDQALTELRKVTDETEATYDNFLNTASKTAFKLGSTLTSVTSATAEFAKLGYSMEMAAEMAESALVYANVGDGIGSSQEAAESIISTLKGFNIEAEKSMSIVDKFNEVGNNFSITSKGIGDALMKSASALSVAGNTIDESVALITAANEVVNWCHVIMAT